MSFKKLQRVIERELRAGRHANIFRMAKRRRDAFKGYADVAALLNVFTQARETPNQARWTLTRELICEYQNSSHSLWASILSVAYAPMLLKLRGRLRNNTLSPADRNQITLVSFFETIARFPIHRETLRECPYLRYETARAVFRQLRKDASEHTNLNIFRTLAVHLGGWNPFLEAPEAGDNPDELKEMGALLESMVDDHDRSHLPMLNAVFVNRKGLSQYVYDTYPDASLRDSKRIYHHLRYQLSQARTNLKHVDVNKLSRSIHEQGAEVNSYE